MHSWDGVTKGDRAPAPHNRWGQALSAAAQMHVGLRKRRDALTCTCNDHSGCCAEWKGPRQASRLQMGTTGSRVSGHRDTEDTDLDILWRQDRQTACSSVREPRTRWD